jgi:ribosomal protein S12 methylthiotransferase
MPSVALQNLGCSKNIVDGERILHLFTTAGFECTDQFAIADVIVVNTCAFIREAQEEAIDSILESASFKKNGKCSTLVVSGCFSERYRAEVALRFPEVDLWVGVNDWDELLPKLYNKMVVSPFQRELSEPIATQYLKIAEGCSHGCTFCVIPSIRGPFKSRTPESILDEAKWLDQQGVQELILVAQDTSFYGRDTGLNLSTLLEKLLHSTQFPWIRMMYLHPKHVDDTFLKLIASEPRICPYFDIPIQHIAEPILKAMNRTPLTADIYKMIERIRTIVPEASIRSSFILGFPGETESHFHELQKFIEFARFDKLGVFPYSPEQGTRAYDLKPRPRASTSVRRCEELMLQQREISQELMEAKIGKTLDVIIEGIAEDPDFNFEARTRFDAPEVDGRVMITSGSFIPGTINRVNIIGALDYDLLAEPLK